MVFCCEISLFLLLTFSLLLFNRLRPWIPLPPDFKYREKGCGRWELDGSPLFKRGLSKCLMHYNEKRHLYSHKALSVSAHSYVLSQGQNTFVLSSLPWRCREGRINSHTLLSSCFTQTSTQYTPPTHLSFLSVLEYPVFHSAAPWAVWMCLVSYVTSFLESLPAALCPLHNLWAIVSAVNEGPFFSAFLRHKYDPLMERMALNPVLKDGLPPNTGETIPPRYSVTSYITAEAQRSWFICVWFKHIQLIHRQDFISPNAKGIFDLISYNVTIM